MGKKIFAIVNPVSNNGKTARIWPRYEKYFVKRGVELVSWYTEKSGHGIELARDAAQKGYHQIMAVGGDGTVNEVVNGLFQDDRLIDEMIGLIVFAQGTGSDYIKTLGIGNKLDDILNIIKQGKKRFVDIGKMIYTDDHSGQETRYFVNVADVGIGGTTARVVNNSSKLFGGFLSYLFGVLRTIFSYRNKYLIIKIDDQLVYNEVLNSVMVANGKFFGGGIKIAPMADPENGFFNIIVLRDLNKLEIVLNLIKAYQGTHLSHPKVDSLFGKEICLKGDKNLIMELDGEVIGKLPATFTILKNKLPIVVN